MLAGWCFVRFTALFSSGSEDDKEEAAAKEKAAMAIMVDEMAAKNSEVRIARNGACVCACCASPLDVSCLHLVLLLAGSLGLYLPMLAVCRAQANGGGAPAQHGEGGGRVWSGGFFSRQK